MSQSLPSLLCGAAVAEKVGDLIDLLALTLEDLLFGQRLQVGVVSTEPAPALRQTHVTSVVATSSMQSMMVHHCRRERGGGGGREGARRKGGGREEGGGGILCLSRAAMCLRHGDLTSALGPYLPTSGIFSALL